MKIQMTVMDLCKKTGMEYATAMGLVKVMLLLGIASVEGKRKTLTGKGKPSIIYEFPTEFTVNIDALSEAVKQEMDKKPDGQPEEVGPGGEMPPAEVA